MKFIYPDDWEHIIFCLAHRIQKPGEKIHHALVLGGFTRMGKDTILKPVVRGIGSWNFAQTNAQTIMDEPKFTPYLESVLCLINEASDFNDDNRFGFYNRLKPWLGGTASGVLMVADKNVKVHPVMDLWFAVITTNHKVQGGLFLLEDDTRHYVAWSPRTPESWDCANAEEVKRKVFDPFYVRARRAEE